jgi:hypothetical protein
MNESITILKSIVIEVPHVKINLEYFLLETMKEVGIPAFLT